MISFSFLYMESFNLGDGWNRGQRQRAAGRATPVSGGKALQGWRRPEEGLVSTSGLWGSYRWCRVGLEVAGASGEMASPTMFFGHEREREKRAEDVNGREKG